MTVLAIEYTSSTGTNVWAAEVQFFARISMPGRRTSRLAFCHHYGRLNMIGELLPAEADRPLENSNYPVELSTITSKLMYFFIDNDIYFRTYEFRSKLNR